MTLEQATVLAAGIGLIGAVVGAVIGALIAAVVAVQVTKLQNAHAINIAADEHAHQLKLADDDRAHQEKVRRKAAGIVSAKAALDLVDRIRLVFVEYGSQWGTPDQDPYKAAYLAVSPAVVDIDDDRVAKVLKDIADAYWGAWLATELGTWSSWTLNQKLWTLATGTVRAYTQDEELPDRSDLDSIMREIDYRIADRDEDERRAREEERKEREAQQAATDTTVAPSGAPTESAKPRASRVLTAAKGSARARKTTSRPA